MITATSKTTAHVTELTDGRGHYLFADVPTTDGGSDLYPRPGELLASAYAACMNITARKLLAREGLTCDEVITRVEMDRSDPEHVVFRSKTELRGDLPQEVREQIFTAIQDCPVCQILRAEKSFLPLSE